MRIVTLSAEEAANAEIMGHVARYLLVGDEAATFMETRLAARIAPEDAPDAGKPFVPPAISASKVVPPPAPVDTAAIFGVAPAPAPVDTAAIFGGAAAPVPPPVPAPSTAAVAAPATAPATSIPLPPAAAPLAPAPASASPAPAPSAAAAPSIPAAAGSPLVLDSRGLPWEPRIHAGTKTRNDDGSWRYKRGTAKETIEAVEAEMRRTLAIPAPTQQTLPIAAPTPAIPPAPAPVPLPPAPAPAAGAAVGAPIPPECYVGKDGQAITFSEWVEEINPLMMSGVLGIAQMKAFCQARGLDDMNGLVMRPDLIPGVRADVRTAFNMKPAGV